MYKIMKPILEGSFNYESGSLSFSCLKIENILSPGTVYEGSFIIQSTPGSVTNGFITSSDLRMECLTPKFSGSQQEIAYRFHAEDMIEGDIAQGDLFIVSNHGEYYLPFTFSIEHKVLDSSIGSIKNMFHFTNLAKSNWLEAVTLFYSPEFKRIFRDNDKKYLDCYRGLSACSGNEQNMEEFLMEINKKQKVEYIIEESEITVDNPIGNAEYRINIVRNGWGYTKLNVKVKGDFLHTQKEVLTDDEFLGNYCSLPFYIDNNVLHAGKNFGKITLTNFYTTIHVPITVRKGESQGITGGIRREKKRLTVQLMKFYQAFRLKKIGSSTWLKESGKLVERMVELEHEDMAARLFQGQLLITEERYNEAQWVLEHVHRILEPDKKKQPVLWAYYLYLTTLISKDAKYIDQVTSEVEYIYRKNKSSWQVAWLLLYLSVEYSKSMSGKWLFLEKLFSYGCRSPIIYIEVLLMMRNNPALLRKLDTFELQVLYYGAKQEMLSLHLIEQLLYLSGKVKTYSPALMSILEHCYRGKPDVRILQEICSMLIKGNKTEHKYFEWYELGVEHELRITKLYEYYMMSIDLELERELPKIVLMYFSYQNNLDYEQNAFLYSYILRNKKQFEELYYVYRNRIECFVLEQIQKERINQHLAYLYQELLTPAMIGEEVASSLSRLLFAHLIKIETLGIYKVIVYQPYNNLGTEYVITGNYTWISLYGNEYTIIFEDLEGNRYSKNVLYTTEKLLLPKKFIDKTAFFVNNCIEFNLFLWENRKDNYEFFEKNTMRCLKLAKSPDVDVKIRRDISIHIMHYFYDTDNIRKLDAYLEQISPKELTDYERGEVLRFMVLRGQFHLAYGWIVIYGPFIADGKTLAHLISHIMQETDYMEDPILIGSAIYAFRKGKYDGNILRYLIKHYKGMTKELRDIWKAAKSFDVDCYELDERLILQMLYAGSYVGESIEIFRDYVQQGGKSEVIEAFLLQCSYDYFVKENVIHSYVFEEIYNLSGRSDASMHRICKLAFLKFYSENPKEITDNIELLIEAMLEELLEDGIHLKFFREFKNCQDLLSPMLDKTIIEYRAHPNAKVYIHYIIVDESEADVEYRIEEMVPVYGGVYFKEFVLFFGESLQYYIVEELNGTKQLTESQTIQMSDIQYETEKNRFEIVNAMTISRVLQDYDTLDCLLEEYYRKTFLNSKLFIQR